MEWFVREFNPQTGATKDIACRSIEHADEVIRQKQRDFTADPVQTHLIELTSTLIRQIQTDDVDGGINQLIVKLGGDASVRSVKPIGWDEARELICDEMGQKGRAEEYIGQVRRITSDFGILTGLTEWSHVDLDAFATYRQARMKGGWKRGGRAVKAVGGRAINTDFGTLSGFLSRLARKGYLARNPFKNAPDERVKVPSVRVAYMPDDDLRVLIAAAGEFFDPWVRTFVLVGYYTAARRSDVLRLEWDRDIDLDGTKAVEEGRVGPQCFVRGAKADTPHWMPLHPAAVDALRQLRKQPVIDKMVFPVHGCHRSAKQISVVFADLCVKAGLTIEVERNGKRIIKNKWKLHDLRRKANTDLRNRGASPKERATMLGHRTTTVNELHYEAILPGRERELIDGLPAFGKAESA